MPFPTEQPPLYQLPTKKSRIILPQIISLFFLSLIFYLGLLFNISLLKLTAAQESNAKLVSFIALLLIIISGIFFSFKKAKQNYLFYYDQITYRHKQLFLNEIIEIKLKQNFLDKLFKTYSLILTKNFSISYIPSEIQIQDYLQKLVAYAKSRKLI